MKNYHFSTEQINIILDSLSKQPYVNVVEIINSIQQQFAAQLEIQNNTESIESD